MTDLAADDAFLDHYGFAHDPFAARVPGFKFFPAQRKPVLGQLHHLARYSQLVLVVTGPQGSGKTLLRQALVASSNKQSVQSIVITPQGSLDASALLQQIGQALGVTPADYDSVMAQIIQLALTGQEVYLLVDDAERLTGAAIETLMRLAEGPEARPHVFLFGLDSLVPRLEALSDGSAQEAYHVIALQPYEPEETQEYLAARLEGAGGDPDCFSAEQVTRIHEASGGWPGIINEVARDELIEGMQVAASAGRRGRGWALPLPKKHALAVLAVLLLVVAALVLRGGGEPDPTDLAGQAGESSSAPAGVAGPGAAIEFNGAEKPLPLPLGSDAQPVIREPLAAAAGEQEEGLGEPVEAEPTPPVVDPVAPPPASPAPAPAPAPRAIEPPAPKVEAPRPAVAAPARSDTASSLGWYGQQPATNYLVQLVGTRNEQNAKAMVQQYGSSYRYFTKLHEGKPLYVVTYGNFASRTQAVAALKQLPQKLQAGKPWVRSLGSVQNEIRAAR